MKPELQQLLDTAYYAWFTTVRADGMPQPTPVWFIWSADHTSLILFSEPNQQKIKNIAQNANVALNWSNEQGYPFVTVMGTAKTDTITQAEWAVYVLKYAQGIKDLNMTPEQFATTYSVGIRITPDKARGGL